MSSERPEQHNNPTDNLKVFERTGSCILGYVFPKHEFRPITDKFVGGVALTLGVVAAGFIGNVMVNDMNSAP